LLGWQDVDDRIVADPYPAISCTIREFRSKIRSLKTKGFFAA
jgi:hypothetical protein